MSLAILNLAKKVQGQVVVPVSSQTQYQPLCTDPTTAEGSANLLQPGAITRAAQSLGAMGFAGTSVVACLRYQTDQSVTTAPVIQLVGFDANGVPRPLVDAAGASSWTLTAATGTDKQDISGNSYTADVGPCDARGLTNVMALISTALVGGGTVPTSPAPTPAAPSVNGPQIMVKSI
jgi:hypothetical protein